MLFPLKGGDMGRIRADIVSLLRRDDDLGFLAAFERAGAGWKPVDLEAAAREAGMTRAKARRLVQTRLGQIVGEARDEAALLAARDRIRKLAAALGLDEAAHMAEIARRAEQVLVLRYAEMFDRDEVDTMELGRLAGRLGVEHERATEIVASEALSRMHRYIGAIMADGRIDPREDAGLDVLKARLGASALEFDTTSQAAMDRARGLWALENEPLAPMDCSIILARGETCYWEAPAAAAEQRSRTVAVNYAGPTASFKIMPGVRYRVGSIASQRVTRDYEHSFGVGSLVITDRRIVWLGQERTITIKLASIVDLQAYLDALEIRKSTGKPIRFYYGESEAPAIIARRVIAEA